MREIQLSTYNVSVGPVRESLVALLDGNDYTNIIVLVDEHTQEHCLPQIADLLPLHIIVTVDAGEAHKNLNTCEKIWSQMADAKIDRHALMINLGGGVIGDMGGFVASTYMRGIDFVQIPTTLLSQVDASVGGKLGVDFKGLKNYIGLFKNPQAVLVDPKFLDTLILQERRSGYAEIIKHALIRDRQIWKRLTSNTRWINMDREREIYDSIMIKRNIVTEDPHERGLRKILNFGHTLGHAIETLSFSTSRPFLHGEAIAIGMTLETMLSKRYCGLSPAEADDIIAYLHYVYKGLDLSILNRSDEIISLLTRDKKNKGGKIMFSLLKNIGEATWDVEVENDDIVEYLNLYYQLHQVVTL